MDSDETEARLVALESRLTHQERMAEDLSDALVLQSAQMDRLTRQVKYLREKLSNLEPDWSASPADEKPPPHY